MNSSDILRLLQTNHYAPAELEQVKQLCRNYPEFNLAHMLKARMLEALGRDKEMELKLAAVYAADRKQLMKLVQGSTETARRKEEALELREDLADAPIEFGEEDDAQAELIIQTHAPYGADQQSPPREEGELLELEEEMQEEDDFQIEEAPSGEDLTGLVQEEAAEAEEEQAEEVQTEEEQAEELQAEEEQAIGAEAGPEEDKTTADLLLAGEKKEADMEDTEPGIQAVPAIDLLDEDEEEKSPGPGSRSKEHLIASFIKEDPGPIRADKQSQLKGDVSLSSIREHDGYITDTLARIYVKQGLFAKAIYAYERLSLKYPEKSAYFAAQIEKIRNINS